MEWVINNMYLIAIPTFSLNLDNILIVANNT